MLFEAMLEVTTNNTNNKKINNKEKRDIYIYIKGVIINKRIKEREPAAMEPRVRQALTEVH